MVSGTNKTETFPIPRVLYVRMSRKDVIFDGVYTKEEIVDALPFDYKDNIEEDVSEVTVMDIEDLWNKCMRET